MADGRHPFGVRRIALATVNDDLPSGAKPGRIGAFDDSGGCRQAAPR
jgi:hypothetical protein